MAVTKLWSVKSNLKQVIDYAVNPEKTAADVYTEEQYQALADVLSYAKDEENNLEQYFRGLITVFYYRLKIRKLVTGMRKKQQSRHGVLELYREMFHLSIITVC